MDNQNLEWPSDREWLRLIFTAICATAEKLTGQKLVVPLTNTPGTIDGYLSRGFVQWHKIRAEGEEEVSPHSVQWE